MKKTIFFLLPMIFFITNCKKSKEVHITKISLNEDELVLKVENLLNETFKEKSNYVSNSNVRRKKWIRVLKEDLKGALTGGAAGATIGSEVGGVTGAVVGAVVGGIMLGASFSVDEAVNGDDPVNRTTLNPTLNITYNNNNPYEIVGLKHNVILNYCINNFTLIPVNSGTINFESYYNDTKTFLYDIDTFYVNSNLFRTTMREYFINSLIRNQELNENLNYLYQNGMVNLTERNILRAYFNFIDAISGNAVLSNQEFQTISIQLENLINNSALPQSSKS
jgi:uncharacterized protein YcfJ